MSKKIVSKKMVMILWCSGAILALVFMVITAISMRNFLSMPTPVYTLPAETLLLERQRYLEVIKEEEPGIFAVIRRVPEDYYYDFQALHRLEGGEFVVTTAHGGFPISVAISGMIVGGVCFAAALVGIWQTKSTRGVT